MPESYLRRKRQTAHLFSFLCLSAGLAALVPAHAFAAVYRVGPDQSLKTPSEAARVVRSGDTVQIEPKPGGYYDCAVWGADDLTIEGIGNDVLLTDKTCEGKAIFVTRGERITIRNLTFARARVPDRNGAGVRAEGADLRIEKDRFTNNESAILAASSSNSQITISDSQFTSNGICTPDHCAPALEVDNIAALTISHCEIADVRGGDAIRSLAANTRLIGNEIRDGPTGTAAYFVELPAGGSLEMQNNLLQRGPLPYDPPVAVRVMQGTDAHAVNVLQFSGNTLKNESHAPLTFVLNWTATRARMENNHLPKDATLVSSSGYLWFLTKSSIHWGLDAAKELAREVYHRL